MLDNIKLNVYNNHENKRGENENLSKIIHACDFELALTGAIRHVYPKAELNYGYSIF